MLHNVKESRYLTKHEVTRLAEKKGFALSTQTIEGFNKILSRCREKRVLCQKVDNQVFITQIMTQYPTHTSIYDEFQSYFDNNDIIIEEFNVFTKKLFDKLLEKYAITNICINQDAIIEFLSNIINKIESIQFPIPYKRDIPNSIYNNYIIDTIESLFWKANSNELIPKMTIFSEDEMNIYQRYVNDILADTNKKITELNLVDNIYIYFEISKYKNNNNYLLLCEKLETFLLHKLRLDVINEKIVEIFKTTDMRHVTSPNDFRLRLEKQVSLSLSLKYDVDNLHFNKTMIENNRTLAAKYNIFTKCSNYNLENIYYILLYIYYLGCNDLYKKCLTLKQKPSLSQYLRKVIQNDREYDLNFTRPINAFNRFTEILNQVQSNNQLSIIK